MCDAPSVFSACAYKAKTPKRCCECGREILPGELYEYVFGVWDDPIQFCTCAECYETREQMFSELQLGDLYDEEIYCALAFGNLAWAIVDAG